MGTEEDWRTYTEVGAMPFTTTPRGDSKEWEELNGTERSAVVELGSMKLLGIWIESVREISIQR